MGELRPADVQLTEMAARLRLTYTRDHLVELVETAATSHMTPRETLEYVFRKEIEQRDGNRVRLAQMSAHFPFAATMDGFDMSFQPSIDPGRIRELASLGWVISGENVILIGPSGVGKTHLSIALGQLALQNGLSVRFYSVTRLVEQMEKAYNAGTFDEKIRDVNKPKLLILDELGYIGEFSFQVQDPRQSCGVLQQSIPVPFSTRELSSAGCLSGTLPSSISHAG